MRKVIFHYHLFKNAGTSLDHMLRTSFGSKNWQEKEFPIRKDHNREQVIKWIVDNPSVTVFSSHTAVFPPPIIPGVKVIPVVFVRHPVDRIYSAYKFEKKQTTDNFGAVLARNTDFSGYVQCRMALPVDRQCNNFHMYRFADLTPTADLLPRNSGQQSDEYDRTIKGLHQLPFIGVVERFSESVNALNLILSDEGFNFKPLRVVKQNTTNENDSLSDKLKNIEIQLGKDVYDLLIKNNEDDIKLYNHVLKNYSYF